MNIDINETILIVVGSELVPEEKDRPLAYRLKERIDSKGCSTYQRAIVVSDRWYLDNDMFHICPTIIIGGPGVNYASAEFYKDTPVVWSEGDNAFLQVTEEDTPNHALLWGMDQAGSEQAINHFVEGKFLDHFLSRSWKV